MGHLFEKIFEKIMKKEIKLFDDPKNVKKVVWGMHIVLAALLVAEFFIHKHPHFPFEGAHGFFAAYGFAACVLVIFISKILRFFVKRDEDYYE